MLITIPNCHTKIIFVICWNITKLLTLPKLNYACLAQETISFCFDNVLLVLQSVQSKLLFSAITHLIYFIRYIVLNRNQAVCITINVLAVGPHPSSESLYPLNSLKAIKLINGTWRMRITQNLSLMQFLSHCLVSLLFLLSSVSHCRPGQYPKSLCSQTRQIQWSCITHSEIPFLLNMAVAPPSLFLLLNPANIFFSNELWVCCHCPRAKKKCWERNEHGDEPIHSKRALHGKEDYLTWSLRWSIEEEESVKNVKG